MTSAPFLLQIPVLPDNESTVSKMETVQIEGVRSVKREQNFYDLDAIISVGYRVNSRRATSKSAM